MKINRVILSLIFIFIVCITGCLEKKIKGDSEVVVAVDSQPQSLDPRVGTDVSSQKIHQLIFNGLVKKNQEGNIVPDLITKYRFKDNLTLLVTIKKNVKFHDGTPLTAYDVQYTYQSLMNKKFISLRKNSFSSIKTIKVIDNGNIEIKLSRIDASLFNNLVIGTLKKGTSQKQINNLQIIGSGPFKFIAYKDNIIKLKPFKLNNENKNNFERLTIKVISDAVTRGLEIQNRSVDIAINNIPFDNLKVLKKRDDLKIINSPGSRYSYIAYNLNDKFLKIPEVRKAICYAIDRDKVIKYLYSGFARKAESVLPIKNKYFLKMKSRAYNPELSRKLLGKVGITSQNKIKFELKVSNTGIGKKLGMVLAEELSQIGVDVRVIVKEFSSFYNDIKKGNFQLYVLAWVGISDPDIFHYIFHSSMIPPNGANRGFFKSDQIDFLTEKVRGFYQFEDRLGIYHKIQSILYEQLPYVSLWYEDNLAVLNKRIKAFNLYAFGDFYPLKDIQIITEE